MIAKRIGNILAPLFAPFAAEIVKLREDLATIYATEKDRERRGVVAIEFPRALADQCRDWGAPVQVRIVEPHPGRYELEARAVQMDALASLAVHQQQAAQRAARQ